MAFHALSKNALIFIESLPDYSLGNLKIGSYVLKCICEIISLKVNLLQSFFERDLCKKFNLIMLLLNVFWTWPVCKGGLRVLSYIFFCQIAS